VVALVLSVVACCPLVSLLGALLGIAAYRRITLSGGLLRGRRVAQTAIILGVGLSIASSIVWSKVQSSLVGWTNDAAVTCVESFVRAAQRGDASGARSRWAGSTQAAGAANDDSVLGFGAAASDRYGSLRAFRVTSIVSAGSMLASGLDVAGTFSFERRELPGSAGFVLEPVSMWSMPVLRLRQIVIEDAQAGDLALPQRSRAAASNPASRP
jgi:hypothetical protein